MNYLRTYLPYLFGNKKGRNYKLPKVIPWESLPIEEKLMFHTLGSTLQNFLQTLDPSTLTKQQIFHIFNYSCSFSRNYPREFDLFNEAVNAQALSVVDTQEVLDFKNNQLSLFALLPSDRRYPGKLLIKKSNGEFLNDSLGNIWNINILGLSSRGMPFRLTSGNTPMGIYSVDGVMPEANKVLEFGNFRRLIINFQESTNLIPRSQLNKSWWKQAELARELGRNLLRIHGAGLKNRNIFSSFYPFIPTSGCLATDETRNDQRHLLDAMMEAQGISVCFENEATLKAVLYVLEFNENFTKLRF